MKLSENCLVESCNFLCQATVMTVKGIIMPFVVSADICILETVKIGITTCVCCFLFASSCSGSSVIGDTMATEVSWEDKFYDLQNRYNIVQKEKEEIQKRNKELEKLNLSTKNSTNDNANNNTINKEKRATWDIIYDVCIFIYFFIVYVFDIFHCSLVFDILIYIEIDIRSKWNKSNHET